MNHGYFSGTGRYGIIEDGNPAHVLRGDTMRQGWLVKGIAEYQFEWGTPGIPGWYATGDDGNIKNGSERIPSLEKQDAWKAELIIYFSF